MVKIALLSTDIETGSKLLEILDQSAVKIDVALWTVLPEYEDWRLVISARRFDAAGVSKAYRLIHESLDAVEFPRWKTPIIMLLPMKDRSFETCAAGSRRTRTSTECVSARK